MEKYLIVLMVLCTIFTISEVSCFEKNSTCLPTEVRCRSDEDCCNMNCRRSVYFFTKYCREPTKGFHSVKSPLFQEVVGGKCLYRKSTNDEERVQLYRAYGASAANAVLQPGTVIEVIVNHTKQLITIDNRYENTNDYLLNLSEDAATLLGIKQEGVVDCEMRVPLLKNSVLLQGFLIISPVLLSVIGLILFNKYA